MTARWWSCSGHPWCGRQCTLRKAWVYFRGWPRGEALLPPTPCLQPQLFLWQSSLRLKTHHTSPLLDTLSVTLQSSSLPRRVVCCSHCSAFASEMFSVRRNPAYGRPWATHPLLSREHSRSPRASWWPLWALTALFRHKHTAWTCSCVWLSLQTELLEAWTVS